MNIQTNLLDIKHVRKNAIVNLGSQLILAIVMFGLAKVILMCYGDIVNGLVRSIVMLTGYFSLVDAGIAAIISQRLYKLVANNDIDGINHLMGISKKIFYVVSIMFVVVCILTTIIYPFAIQHTNIIDFPFVAALIFVLSIKAVPNYLWNIHYNTLFTAMQKGYVYKVLNLLVSIIFYSIAALLIYFTRPELVSIVKNGDIIYNIKPSYENHKWWIVVAQLIVGIYILVLSLFLKIYAGKKLSWLKFDKVPWKETKFIWSNAKYTLASAVCWLVVFSTDEIVLTIYSHKVGANESLYLVSLLSMYGMLIFTGRSLLDNFFSAMVPNIGLETKGHKDIEQNKFKLFIYGIISISFISVVALTFLSPIFIQIFFNSHANSNYFDIKLAALLCINVFLYLIMIPYKTLFTTRGDFKGLLLPNVFEAIANFTGSIICVWFFGVYGILIVTAVVMFIRFLDFSFRGRRYVENHKSRIHNIAILSIVIGIAVLAIIAFLVPKVWTSISMDIWPSIGVIVGIGAIALIIIIIILFSIKIWSSKIKKNDKKIIKE